MERTARPYFGWYVVFACFWIAVFGWGLGFYGQGVYLAELQRSRGWSVSLISTATTVYYLAGAALLVFVGEAIDRFGSRPVVLAGLLALACGTASLGIIVAPWQLYAADLLMALGWAAMSSTAITTTLAPWFIRRRGLAISLALTGASGGGILVVPALVALTARYGFARAVLVVVGAMVAVLVPLIVACLRRPAHLGPHADAIPASSLAPRDDARRAPPGRWTRARALRSPGFWTFAVAFALGLTAQVGFLIHQIAFLTPSTGAARAGAAVGATTIAAVSGRVWLGFFIDRWNPRAIAALLFASQAGALLVLIGTRNVAALYLACVGFGFSVGNVITLPALIVQREYDAASFGLILGLSTAISQFTYAFGPSLLGIVRDATGGYAASLALCMALELAAAAILLAKARGDA